MHQSCWVRSKLFSSQYGTSGMVKRCNKAYKYSTDNTVTVINQVRRQIACIDFQILRRICAQQLLAQGGLSALDKIFRSLSKPVLRAWSVKEREEH